MNLSVSHPLDSRSPFGTCVPPPPAGGVFPDRGALGKEVSFSMKPTGAYWKTSRNAKASHFGRGVCGADGEGKDAAKEPDTQRYAPCLSEPSYRNAAGVISPGLPSQALTRQLPQSGSPWQRGLVFDETDWGLLENVTECQSLSCQERWHRAKRRCRRGCTEQHLRYSAHSKGVLCPTSQTPAAPAPLAGEPLAKRFRFR